MSEWLVTTAETVYETYRVEAASPETAKALVADSEHRNGLDSWPVGSGDDSVIIDIRPLNASDPRSEERGPDG